MGGFKRAGTEGSGGYTKIDAEAGQGGTGHETDGGSGHHDGDDDDDDLVE
jgi:hypothetical protein